MTDTPKIPADKPVKPDAVKGSEKPSAAGPKPARKAVKVKPPRKPKSGGIGVPALLLFSVLAAGIGGAIGWLGPQYFDPANAAPAQAITQNAAQMKTMSADMRAQEQVVSDLTSTQSRMDSQLSALADLQGRLSAAEQEVAALRQAQSDIAAAQAQRLDLVEGLITPDDNPDAAPSALAQKLSDLEGQMAALKLAAMTAEPVVISYDKNTASMDDEADAISAAPLGSAPMEETALKPLSESESESGPQSEPEPQSETEPQSEPQASYDFAANFPKAEMLAALKAQTENLPEPSWLRRTLQKHVQSDAIPQPDARAVIDKAEAKMRAGDITGAAQLIETLNPTLRAAAYEWLLEARKLR